MRSVACHGVVGSIFSLLVVHKETARIKIMVSSSCVSVHVPVGEREREYCAMQEAGRARER